MTNTTTGTPAKKSFRNNYDKDFDFFLQEELKKGYPFHPFHAPRRAMYSLRMYANLFNRDMRKILLVPGAVCAECGNDRNLQIDHITPISKGGKNVQENVRVLCQPCNRKKSNNI